MTRENLLQAIYDNEDNWSCQYTCPHTMEEESPQVVCMECADKLLAEYEKKIRADVIDEYVKLFIENALIDESKTWTEYARKVAEQLKEQKK